MIDWLIGFVLYIIFWWESFWNFIARFFVWFFSRIWFWFMPERFYRKSKPPCNSASTTCGNAFYAASVDSSVKCAGPDKSCTLSTLKKTSRYCNNFSSLSFPKTIFHLVLFSAVLCSVQSAMRFSTKNARPSKSPARNARENSSRPGGARSVALAKHNDQNKNYWHFLFGFSLQTGLFWYSFRVFVFSSTSLLFCFAGLWTLDFALYLSSLFRLSFSFLL